MTTKTTRWHPSSCGCVVDYTWDDAADPADIVFTPVAIQPCAGHADKLKADGLVNTFEAILSENRALAADGSADQQS